MSRPQTIRSDDTSLDQVKQVLAAYETAHPSAKTRVKRQNSVSIRILIEDPAFKSMSLAERETDIWTRLQALPDEVYGDISMLLLLTPEEANRSLVKLEFDDPTPSGL